MEEEDINWKERCLILETSLQKFREQVTKIRETLGFKVKDLEGKKLEAEYEAKTAADKIQIMEQQLAAINMQPDELDDRIHILEKQCVEKEEKIRSLQLYLEEQKLQRQHDAKMVEEKAGKIKEWVTSKLQQIETKNQELQQENESLQDQVEILRERLQALPAFAAKEIYRLSQQSSVSRASSYIEEESSYCADSRPNSIFTDISHLVENAISRSSSRPQSETFSPIDLTDTKCRPVSEGGWSEARSEVIQLRPLSRTRPSSDYAESRSRSDVSSSSQDMSEDSIPPAIPKRPSPSVLQAIEQELEDKRENSISPPSDTKSSASMKSDKDTALDSNSDDSMPDIETIPLYHEVDQNHESTYELKKCLPPQVVIGRKVFSAENRLLDSLVSSSNDDDDKNDGKNNNSFLLNNGEDNDFVDEEDIIIEDIIIKTESSPAVTLTPMSARTPISPFFPSTPSESPSNVYNHSSNNVSAIATLPRVKKRHDKSSPLQLMYSAGGVPEGIVSHDKPPPVLEPHIVTGKTSSFWDSRTYAIPKKVKDTIQQHTSTSKPSVPQTVIGKLYKEFDVPVYATLKGKAAQIRSTPFTEDSSTDSSDEDCSLIVTQAEPSKTNKVQQSSSGAIKRGVSSYSASSEVSCDYVDPPEENSGKSDSDTSEPEQKLLKYAVDNCKHDTLEKFGYLSKLGGKVKMWKRRWFVLRNGELFYYKSQHDVLRKPQGSIKLDDQSRVVHTKGEMAFQITSGKKTYYFTADTVSDTEKWIRLLQKVFKRQATSFLLDHMDTKAVLKGTLHKVRNGVTRKCWCVLVGRYLIYHRNPSDKTPLGQIHLRDARIEDIDNSNDSDDEADVTKETKHAIAIWPPFQGPTYLMLPSQHEKDSWLYHLTVAAGGGTGNVGTEYEQIISKVMECNADSNSVYWKHPLLLHSKDPINKPLTTLPSAELELKALEIFKLILQFTYTLIESTNLEYHTNLSQKLLDICLAFPELQNELFCQLIKQTSSHPVQQKTAVQNLLLCGKHSWYLCHATPTSPTGSIMDLSDSRLNPAANVILQGWQLLSMCVSLFLPKQSIMWHLRVHLQRHADQRSDIGKYAIFCQRALERTILKGIREVRPSRMEVLSILLRNPYHHSQPISIPVHFLNNTYQVVSFDGSTTVEELLHSLTKKLSMRDSNQSGFALFSDDPCIIEGEHFLQSHIKVCDVISKWEHIFKENNSGKLDSSRTIKFLYKNRLYFKSTCKSETDKEKLLLAYQINDDIVQGRFPLNKDLALELTSLLAQVEYGDLKLSTSDYSENGDICQTNVAQQVSTVLDRFYPKKFTSISEEEQRSVISKLLERWSSLRGRSAQDCIRVYLAVVRKWQNCGAKLFRTKTKTSLSNTEDVWLAVHEEGITVLEYSTMQPIISYDYRSVITFGGWKDDFMIVATQLIESAPHHYEHRTEKLLFTMQKWKILEITLLMASYINVRVQRSSNDISPET
ncbi:Hypothetical predicted protein [Mytilus galloprovincialis]|uniref:Uncharacterized protein n=1 Tax=Mytilus galloprovincialis TaxID=29158 RepID=A0A8B6GEL5_MYTGA|nr:Hypothetical predicted protein [Mytilus galloprovincialis]